MNILNATLGVATLAIAVVGVTQMTSNTLTEKKAEIDSAKVKMLADGIQEYLKTNYATLIASQGGVLTSQSITSELSDLDMQVAYRRYGEFPAYTLQAIIAKKATSEKTAIMSAAALDAAGGTIDKADPSKIRGGSYTVNLSDFFTNLQDAETAYFYSTSYTRSGTLQKACIADNVLHELSDVTLKKVITVSGGGGGGGASAYQAPLIYIAPEQAEYVWEPAKAQANGGNGWVLNPEKPGKEGQAEQQERKFYGAPGESAEVREYDLHKHYKTVRITSGTRGAAGDSGLAPTSGGNGGISTVQAIDINNVTTNYNSTPAAGGAVNGGAAGATAAAAVDTSKIPTDCLSGIGLKNGSTVEVGKGGNGAIQDGVANDYAKIGGTGLVYVEYLQW